jgi:hypothetical protein
MITQHIVRNGITRNMKYPVKEKTTCGYTSAIEAAKAWNAFST